MSSDSVGTVLVTGGAGYIGSHVCLALLDAGFPVAVIDNLCTGRRASVPEEASFFEGDIADKDLMLSIMDRETVGAIIHMAGSTLVRESMSDPLKYYDNNTAKSSSLIEYACQHGVKHFLFSSTAAIYGARDSTALTEALPPRPINPYGRSKLLTEEFLKVQSAVQDFNYASLRYFNVAGADPLNRTGQSSPVATHLIKVAVQAALQDHPVIPVFGTDYPTADGTCVRDYIHVSDLAEAHVAALRKLIAEPDRSWVLNCGYAKGFSVLDVLDTVDKVVGTRIERQFQGRREGDPALLVADTSKIRATLDWHPRYDDLETIVRHAFAWERKLQMR